MSNIKDYTSQEILVAECLDILGLRYEPQVKFGQFIVDFFLPELLVVIEADGIYGHLKKANARRDNKLKIEHGIFDIVHIKSQKKDDILQFLEMWINVWD